MPERQPATGVGIREVLRAEPLPFVLAGALGVYLGAILWFSRFHLLDDALIHLRFAELFVEHGFFTADGEAPSFGTSSPLFVLIAAGLHALLPSDFTTKILSVVFYLAFVAGVFSLAWRASGLVRLGWGALLVLAAAPMGVRWLTDGMETSLVASLALALGLVSARLTRLPRITATEAALLAVLGAVCVTTRIEMAALIALALPAAITGAETPTGRLARAAPLVLGGAAGLMLLWWTLGAVVPDSALAKASGEAAPVRSIATILWSFGGGLGFGFGLLGLWLASVTASLRGAAPARRWAVLVPNLALLLVWAFVAARGQYIQGIRPLLSVVVFMIAGNLATVAAAGSVNAARAGRVARFPARWHLRAGAVAAAVIALFAVEFGKFRDIVAHRTEAFVEMRELNLAELGGSSGIGWDVGHVLYFTKAHVCDVSGLINGRRAAASKEHARLENCLRQDVDFVFTTPDKARQLIARSGARFNDWPVCGLYLFQNVGPTAPHILAVSPGLAPRVCPRQLDEAPMRFSALRAS